MFGILFGSLLMALLLTFVAQAAIGIAIVTVAVFVLSWISFIAISAYWT